MGTIAPAAYDSKIEGNVIVSKLDACIQLDAKKLSLANANGASPIYLERQTGDIK